MDMKEIDAALVVMEGEANKLQAQIDAALKGMQALKVKRDAVLEQRMAIIRNQQLERMGMKPVAVEVPAAVMPAPKGR